MNLQLFPQDKVVGIFRGFPARRPRIPRGPSSSLSERVPKLYRCTGSFYWCSSNRPDEAVLGRIASFSSEGKLAFGSGEEFNIRAMREDRPVPEDLREQYLKYRVNIRVLGVLRNNGVGLTFVPSHRRLPHVGSQVAFPSSAVLSEISGHNTKGASDRASGVRRIHLRFGERRSSNRKTGCSSRNQRYW